MNWEMIASVSSAIIALCALIFTLFQSRQLQKHNRLSVKPHLSSWSHKNSEAGFYSVELINNGLGPALIESFEIKVDGKKISGEGEEPLKKALKILFSGIDYESHQSYMAKDYSMAAKERCRLVEIQFKEQPYPSPESVAHAMNRANLYIDYKSFYGEIFHYSSEDEKENM